MQASFWKTVSVVGVIGIGSLVTLEVQNRLSRPGSGVDTSTDAALRNLVIQSGEESLTAATTKSEFDLAMESSNAETPGVQRHRTTVWGIVRFCRRTLSQRARATAGFHAARRHNCPLRADIAGRQPFRTGAAGHVSRGG